MSGAAERDGMREQARRRARLAEVFGDVLPETTADERDSGARDRRTQEAAADSWWRDQVPPHHGS